MIYLFSENLLNLQYFSGTRNTHNIGQFPWNIHSNGRVTHINKCSVISFTEFYTKCCCAPNKPDGLSVEGYTGKATQENPRKLSKM